MTQAPLFEASAVGAFDFRYPKLSRVVLADGCLAREAAAQLGEWGAARAVVVTSRSLAGVPEVRQLLAGLAQAGIEAQVFTGPMQHCPLNLAQRLRDAAVSWRAAALVAVGGSSVSDTAKAAALLAAFNPGEAACVDALKSAVTASRPLPWRLISAPTTLSGGEFTPVVGITDPATGHKAVLRHPGLYSDVVLLDPALQRHTPDRLWAATGFKLLDHAVERLLARNHRPLIDAQCVFGAQWLLSLLEESLGGSAGALQNRGRILQALWVIQSSHGNVGTGLSHSLSHQLGAAYGLDHGCGSAICLPATLRLLDATGRLDAGRVDLVARAVGVAEGTGAVQRILVRLHALRERLGLPGSLAQAGVHAADAAAIARAAVADPTTAASPGDPLTQQEVAGLVEAIQGTHGDAR